MQPVIVPGLKEKRGHDFSPLTIRIGNITRHFKADNLRNQNPTFGVQLNTPWTIANARVSFEVVRVFINSRRGTTDLFGVALTWEQRLPDNYFFDHICERVALARIHYVDKVRDKSVSGMGIIPGVCLRKGPISANLDVLGKTAATLSLGVDF
jgi:hypothetical protein